MNPFIREAVEITRDFGDVTFVGAIAVMIHAGEQRQSKDLDFVVAEAISDEEFMAKKYRIDFHTGAKFTPRNYKIDVFHSRALNDIELSYIIDTANSIVVDSRRNISVRVMSLEGLIISKYRAGRAQDNEDLQMLSIRCGSKIDWQEVRRISKNDAEFAVVENTVEFYSHE